MTTLEAIGAVALAGIFGIIALYFSFRRELRRHGLEMFKLGEVFGMEKGMAEGMAAGIETGWNEGWDDRDKDRYPETPEPQGRHHGISQPEDWTATDLIEFTLPPPPLPKRMVNRKVVDQ